MSRPQLFGVSWYGESASIACTAYAYTKNVAERLAREGAEAAEVHMPDRTVRGVLFKTVPTTKGDNR